MPSKPDDEHPLMTIHAAAVALGCSDMTIRRRVEARQFPAVKIGSKALVPRAFVARLLADALAGRTVVVEEYAAAWANAVSGSAAPVLYEAPGGAA
jgi:excisionase family DNA binding protein